DRVVERGYDRADRARAARSERARSAVRDVAQRLHCLLDALSGGGLDLVRQRERARHGGGRNPGETRHVGELGGLLRGSALHGPSDATGVQPSNSAAGLQSLALEKQAGKLVHWNSSMKPLLPARWAIAPYLAVFMLSGGAGLIYESIWSHYLKLFLGHAG